MLAQDGQGTFVFECDNRPEVHKDLGGWLVEKGCVSMEREEPIHLKYAGFVAFVSNIVGIFTGLAFSMMTVRRLTPEEFGSWQIIGNLIPFFTVAGIPINMLVTRFTSRGIKAARTGLLMSWAFSVLAVVIWFPVTWAFSYSSDIRIATFVFSLAGLQIISIYFTDYLAAVVTAHKPQLVGYSITLSEVIKVMAAYLLVVEARLGLTGAILCTVITYYVRLISLFLMGKRYLEGSLSREHASRLLKLYWLPLFSVFQGRISALDVVLITLFTRSTIPAGLYYSAALVGSIVGYSYALASGLYPSLLRGGSSYDIEESIKLVYMFLIPMGIGTLVIPDIILNVLRPEYVKASMTLAVIVTTTLFGGLSNIVDTVLLGIERSDSEQELKFSKLVRSNLFRVPLVYYINSASYLFAIILTMLFLGPEAEPWVISTAWAVVYLLVWLPFFLLRLLMSTRATKFKIPYLSVLKYLICAILMAFVVIVVRDKGELSREVEDAVVQLLKPVTVGGLAYFVSLYAIDAYFRKVLAEAARRISKSFKRPH